MTTNFHPKHLSYKLGKICAVTCVGGIFFFATGCYIGEMYSSIMNSEYVFVALYSLCFIPPLFLAIWSYFRTVFAYVWLPPNIEDYTEFKTCTKCGHQKPERCHHCSLCNACVLKMDHHCPWLGTCVGFKNHKFFILFLFWSMIGTICMIVFPVIILAVHFFIDQIFSLFDIIHFIQAFIGFSFLWASLLMLHMHIQLAMTNSTTLEQENDGCFISEKKRTRNLYDLGNKRNLQLMFGDSIFKAFIPIYTTQGDGMHWEHNPNCQLENTEDKLEIQETFDPYLSDGDTADQFTNQQNTENLSNSNDNSHSKQTTENAILSSE